MPEAAYSLDGNVGEVFPVNRTSDSHVVDKKPTTDLCRECGNTRQDTNLEGSRSLIDIELLRQACQIS